MATREQHRKDFAVRHHRETQQQSRITTHNRVCTGCGDCRYPQGQSRHRQWPALRFKLCHIWNQALQDNPVVKQHCKTLCHVTSPCNGRNSAACHPSRHWCLCLCVHAVATVTGKAVHCTQAGKTQCCGESAAWRQPHTEG